MADDLAVYNVASFLLDCAVAGLNTTTLKAPARQVVMVGEMAAWDNCCDGQVTVVVTQVYPSSTFPDYDVRIAACGSAYTVINADIEVVRCAPTLDDRGNPPPVPTLDGFARWAHADARAVRTATRCCLYEHRRHYDSVDRGQVFLNDGACGGSRLSLTVGMRDG